MSASGNGGKLRAKSESGAGPNNNTDSQRGSSSRWLATFHRAECPLSGKAENIYSQRAFRLLTQLRHRQCAQRAVKKGFDLVERKAAVSAVRPMRRTTK
jgi:hypothetical protein